MQRRRQRRQWLIMSRLSSAAAAALPHQRSMGHHGWLTPSRRASQFAATPAQIYRREILAAGLAAGIALLTLGQSTEIPARQLA
jgi:hypothetical protein